MNTEHPNAYNASIWNQNSNKSVAQTRENNPTTNGFVIRIDSPLRDWNDVFDIGMSSQERRKPARKRWNQNWHKWTEHKQVLSA